MAPGKRGQLGISPREMNAAAGQDQRAVRPFDDRRGTRHRGGVRSAAHRRRVHRVDLNVEILDSDVDLAVADILRNVENDRPGASRGRDGESAPDELRNALDLLDADELLDDRAQNLGLPRLLGHVLPGVGAVRVADDRHDRHTGVE